MTTNDHQLRALVKAIKDTEFLNLGGVDGKIVKPTLFVPIGFNLDGSVKVVYHHEKKGHQFVDYRLDQLEVARPI